VLVGGEEAQRPDQAEFVQNKDRTCSLAFRLARDVNVNKNKPIAGV
jgi:hypothetical protein